jgi:hypothetical protein
MGCTSYSFKIWNSRKKAKGEIFQRKLKREKISNRYAALPEFSCSNQCIDNNTAPGLAQFCCLFKHLFIGLRRVGEQDSFASVALGDCVVVTML